MERRFILASLLLLGLLTLAFNCYFFGTFARERKRDVWCRHGCSKLGDCPRKISARAPGEAPPLVAAANLTWEDTFRTKTKPGWQHVLGLRSTDHSSHAIGSSGMWEGGVTLLMLWAFREACADQDSLFVDVGMNVGWFSALAAANGRAVMAFEPNPAPRGFMEKTVLVNGWEGQVCLVAGGISRDGASLFVDTGEKVQWGGLAAAREAAEGLEKVKSFRLDEVLGSDARVCVMKLDCQGCEAEAMLSGEALMTKGAIEFMQLEHDFSRGARESLETLRRLSPFKWACVLLPVGLEDVGNESWVWDIVAGGFLKDCSPELIASMAPAAIPAGFYLDLWMMRKEGWDRMSVHPDFAAAKRRRWEATSLVCSYSLQVTRLGVCDLLCRAFPDIHQAQAACDRRPSCTKIMPWNVSFFELRGGVGGQQAKFSAFVKQGCTAQSRDPTDDRG